MSLSDTFRVGSRWFYVLPKGFGRAKPLYLPCTIVNVTTKRLVIRVDGQTSHRNVLAVSLTDKDAAGFPASERSA